jgi:hypothetical protein
MEQEWQCIPVVAMDTCAVSAMAKLLVDEVPVIPWPVDDVWNIP